MPRHLAPNRSGVHRLACLSLYHALLALGNRAFRGSEKADEIRNLVRKRFRKDRKLQSIGQIANALKAGYEALDLFHGCARRDIESIQRVDSLLVATRALRHQVIEEHRAQSAQPPLCLRKRPPPKIRRDRTPEALRPHPDRKPILSRPRPVVSGRRHVPVLVNARGIPFLRIRKPQPPSLSVTIKGLLHKRWKRIERRERLQFELGRAKDEDLWDDITGEKDDVPWTACVRDCLDEVNAQLLHKDLENRAMAQKMWGVVLKERQLAKKEALERRKQKLAEQAMKSD
ncbi:predicted protein [Uncinocarpus reesii 1704]|uniref:Complex 1 LYR protein domain-containing protein n=1 Tax=Uncinocarpus reesii (strain UAMH 1704) TaxID=336963 RepID=C4JSC3_UNCRE|nr:uncharacterized protein UREG_05362 [Uncinocarpus reesii 1704]EEP80520.1 predicted protein [Uncinocarpus reesii 1704]